MIWLISIGVLLCFGLVLFAGAPYLPTLKSQRKSAFEFLNLEPGMTLYELGCGDGTMLIEAARRGIKVTGYELNPLLFAVAWLRTRRHTQLIRLRWGDFWQADIADADGIYVFLHSRFMHKLDQKITQGITKPCTVVSYGFAVHGKKPSNTANGLFVYHYKPLAG